MRCAASVCVSTGNGCSQLFSFPRSDGTYCAVLRVKPVPTITIGGGWTSLFSFRAQAATERSTPKHPTKRGDVEDPALV